jgi:hypothetical protein
MLGLGNAKAITQMDIWEIGQSLKVNPAVIDGIGKTESAGFGWFPNGQIKILPEPHIFYKYLPKDQKAAALKAGLATRSYKETKATGHYKRMTNGPGPRYALFERMIAFNETAAYMAISSGTFQIMGFNFKVCGFDSAKQMFEAFCDSEAVQLQAFVNFIKGQSGGITALRNEDYDKIELLYNGGGQGGAYAREMAINVQKAKKGRWANFHPLDTPAPQDTSIEKKSDGVKILKKGMVGPEVEALQIRLIELGYDVQPDAKFGKLTEEAVKDFQKDTGLTVDGRVGNVTRGALWAPISQEDEKKIQQEVKPVIVTETKKEGVPVVPKEAKKPFWKDWGIGALGTTVLGWVTSLVADLEPWMKFALLVIAIGGIVMAIIHRRKLFNEAMAVIERVQEINDEPATLVEEVEVQRTLT